MLALKSLILASPADHRLLEAGKRLFRFGEPVVWLFAVQDGEVALERLSANGQLLIVQRARAGDVLAEASFFAEAYHCDAVARCRYQPQPVEAPVSYECDHHGGTRPSSRRAGAADQASLRASDVAQSQRKARCLAGIPRYLASQKRSLEPDRSGNRRKAGGTIS